MSTQMEKPMQLQVVDKLRQIPMVQRACSTSSGVYQKVKDSSEFINWTLGSAEGAASVAMGAVAPVAHKLQGPIQYVDNTLCKGIDVLQEKVPCVKEQPQQIVENAKNYVSSSAAIGVGKVQSLTSAGYEKANEVLSSTTVGNMTLNGLDTTSEYANRVIDYYLPASADELNVNPHPNAQCEDKVAHAAHTVGALTYKASTRLYKTVTRRRRAVHEGKAHDSDDDAASVHSSDEEQ